MAKSKAEPTLKSVHTLHCQAQTQEAELSGGGNQEN